MWKNLETKETIMQTMSSVYQIKKIPLFLGIGGFFSFFIILGSKTQKA